MTVSADALRIGIPSKGRLAEAAAELLQEGGLSFRRQERTLFARCRDLPVEIIFLRTEDIPVLCAEGAIDLGITGSDLIAEHLAENASAVKNRLTLGFGSCRLALCVPEYSTVQKPSELNGKRLATSFPNVTQQFLAAHQAKVHLVELTGSVEIMVALGVADAVVDLIETGSTLAANRLRILSEIGVYETILIQNERQRHADLADRVVRRLENVVIARNWSMLEYNVPRSKLVEAENVTPGFHSPTVSPLVKRDGSVDETWCAVRVMVKRGDVLNVMEKLESLGAEAILEMRIANCRL